MRDISEKRAVELRWPEVGGIVAEEIKEVLGLHQNISPPFLRPSISVKIVAPVVVNPDTVSKKQST